MSSLLLILTSGLGLVAFTGPDGMGLEGKPALESASGHTSS